MAASTYSDELADRICDELMLGKSMLKICEREGMPSETTVYRWLQSDEHPGFREKYAQARELQAERMLDEILQIADDTANDTEYGDSGPRANAEWIARSRLKVDSRKWAMSKLAPKKYGDKVALTDGEGKPLAAPVIQIIAPT